MYYTKKEAQLAYPGVIFREGAVIGAGAVIGERAVIGAGAVIREGAIIATICHRYTGNIVPMKDMILLRLGCEMHTADEWAKEGAKICQKHNELAWWESTGERIIYFLAAEACLYEDKEKLE